jgi:hypothetical protein
MFVTIQQALYIYKQELLAYHTWVENVKKVVGCGPDEQLDKFNLADADYNKGVWWTSRLRGMEKLLGLTNAEIAHIEKEITNVNTMVTTTIEAGA